MHPKERFIKQQTKYILQIVTGLLVMGGGAWYFFYGNTEKLQGALKLLPLFSVHTIFLVILLDALQILFMALRLFSLFPGREAPSIQINFKAMSIGQVMNSFLPARAGDFYKLNLLSQSTKSSFLTVTGVMAADKLIDFIAFILLIFLTRSYLHAGKTDSTSGLGLSTWLILLVLVLSGLALYFFRMKAKKIITHLQTFLNGLKGLLRPSQLTLSMFLAVLVWLPEIYALKLLSHGQGIELSFSQIVFLLSVLNLAIAIPLSVANVGPFEASLIFAFSQLGIGLEKALVIASTHHVLQIVGYLLCGGLSLRIRKIT